VPRATPQRALRSFCSWLGIALSLALAALESNSDFKCELLHVSQTLDAAKRDRTIDVEVAPLALDHALLIARSTGRSFSFYAKLESVHAVRSTQ
jgi:hypothetical protein